MTFFITRENEREKERVMQEAASYNEVRIGVVHVEHDVMVCPRDCGHGSVSFNGNRRVGKTELAHGDAKIEHVNEGVKTRIQVTHSR